MKRYTSSFPWIVLLAGSLWIGTIGQSAAPASHRPVIIPAAATPTPGIVLPVVAASYRFQGNADDGSGNSNHGTVFGATLTGDRFGKPNGAYLFNGKSSYLLIPHQQLFTMNQFTIAIWFKVNELPPAPIPNHPGRATLLSKGNYFGIYLYHTGADNFGTIVYTHLTGAGNWLTTLATPVLINQFTHLAISYNGKEVKLYLNGALRKTENNVAPPLPNTLPFLIGKNSDTVNPAYFHGVVDDLDLFTQALGDGDISALFQGKSIQPTPGKVTAGPTQTAAAVPGISPTPVKTAATVLPPAKTAIPGPTPGKTTTPGPTVTTITKPIASPSVAPPSPTLRPVAATPAPFIPQLIASYPFLGNARDVSGKNNHGTVFGALPAPDRLNNPDSAYLLNGKGYIQVNRIDSWVFNQYSLSIWFKITSLPPPPAPYEAGKAVLISRGPNFRVIVERRGGSPFGLITCTHPVRGGSWSTTCWKPVEIDQFIHLVITNDGKNLKMYLNGAMAMDETLAKPALNIMAPLLIGKDTTPNPANFFNGVVDDLQIYSQVLSESGVEAIYAGKNPIFATPTPSVAATPTPKIMITPSPAPAVKSTPRATVLPTSVTTAKPTIFATATPTIVPAASTTPTGTAASPKPTHTMGATPSVKPTATVIPTGTPPSTVKPIPAVTPTATATASATPIATVKPTPTIAAGPSVKPTATIVPTPIPTATVKPTPTSKLAATATPTPVVSAKSTVVPVATPTVVLAVSATPTSTTTPMKSAPTITTIPVKPTATITPTATVQVTPPVTPATTVAPTPAPTAKPTMIPTVRPTAAATPKPTFVPTTTPTVIPAITATPGKTTPTNSAIPVKSPPLTVTPTTTPAAKPTLTSLVTPTPAKSAVTATPGKTPAPTVRSTPTATPTVAPLPKPFAAYPFIGNAKDGSGNNHHGTVFRAVLTSDRFGKPGQAYYFNGAGSYIQGDALTEWNQSRFTISLWFKVASLPPAPEKEVPGSGTILSKGTYFKVNVNRYLEMAYPTVNYIYPSEGGGVWNTMCWFRRIEYNHFHHLAISYDGETLTIYIDGTVAEKKKILIPQVSSNDPLLIGKGFYSKTPEYFHGAIDDLRFYNQVLTDGQVNQLFNVK